jgi:hypothetical protein
MNLVGLVVESAYALTKKESSLDGVTQTDLTMITMMVSLNGQPMVGLNMMEHYKMKTD